MIRRPWISLAAAALLVGGLTLVAHHYLALTRLQTFNTALARGDLASAGTHGSSHGLFARALVRQRDGDYQGALQLYALLTERGDPQLSEAIIFNSGTLYLRWGLTARAAGQEELALPLFELAKETFRSLLSRNHQRWDARYNLERTLLLSPERGERDPDPQGMPEHSPEALGNVESHQQLP